MISILCVLFVGVLTVTRTTDEIMTTYVKHRQGLKRKLFKKKKRRGALSARTGAVDVVVLSAVDVADLPTSPSN